MSAKEIALYNREPVMVLVCVGVVNPKQLEGRFTKLLEMRRAKAKKAENKQINE